MADFAFAPKGDVRLQPYSGSVWRGAFGFALKRLVCVMRMRPCEGCPLAAVCIFPRFFGSDPDHDEPRPYVLAPEPTPPGGWVHAGQPFRVRLTLLGSAEAATAYVMQAVLDGAAHGLTRRRVPFVCLSVTSSGSATAAVAGRLHGIEPVDLQPPPAPPAVRLRIMTPLRLRLSGDLVTGRSLTAGQLIGAILRRARLLGVVVPAATIPSVREQARALAWAVTRFGWLETTRFRSPQHTTMQLGGIVGEARLDLRATPDLWPLLWLASILHVGKGASMGFGGIELHAE
ncbi:CRISPR system precrRNA processing endoribonuclease RAMP protein Cas6 [Elioraea sp.]|uniref:CRISPR system precrRNA processing endoribonuclease RAMP protein Cas6 n=1 Tax=Elioraea sp. TaxID=2185103 RepID=UPI003F6F8EED